MRGSWGSKRKYRIQGPLPTFDFVRCNKVQCRLSSIGTFLKSLFLLNVFIWTKAHWSVRYLRIHKSTTGATTFLMELCAPYSRGLSFHQKGKNVFIFIEINNFMGSVYQFEWNQCLTRFSARIFLSSMWNKEVLIFFGPFRKIFVQVFVKFWSIIYNEKSPIYYQAIYRKILLYTVKANHLLPHGWSWALPA